MAAMVIPARFRRTPRWCLKWSCSGSTNRRTDRLSLIKCEAAFYEANSQLGSVGDQIKLLSEPVRVLLLIYGAQGVIDNGGFKYFFGQDWPGNLPYEEFIAAYETIGCHSQAQELRRVIATFPFSDPHLQNELRTEYINQNYDPEEHSVRGWGDELCGDKVVWKKLAAYYDKNKAAFVSTATQKLPFLRFPSRDARDADHMALIALAGGIYLWMGRTGLPAATAPWISGAAVASAITGLLLWLRIPAAKWLGVLVFTILSGLAMRRGIIQGWSFGVAVDIALPIILACLMGRIGYSHKFAEEDES